MTPNAEQTRSSHPVTHILWAIAFIALLGLAARQAVRTFSAHPNPAPPEVATEAAADEKGFAPASTRGGTDGDASWPPGVSLEQYAQLQTGMSLQAALKLLGEGEEVARSEEYGLIVTYRWQGRGRVNAYARATFHNGRLTTKAQSGLE